MRFRSRPEKFQGKVPEQGFGEVASEVPERFRNKVPESFRNCCPKQIGATWSRIRSWFRRSSGFRSEVLERLRSKVLERFRRGSGEVPERGARKVPERLRSEPERFPRARSFVTRVQNFELGDKLQDGLGHLAPSLELRASGPKFWSPNLRLGNKLQDRKSFGPRASSLHGRAWGPRRFGAQISGLKINCRIGRKSRASSFGFLARAPTLTFALGLES